MIADYEKGLSVARLRDLLRYDPETGNFLWLKSRAGQPRPGSIAGWVRPDGYVQIRIDKHRYLAHRLAWFYINEKWPEAEIDHIDLDPSNNALSNLREARHSQNMSNVLPRKRNKIGLKGAYQTNYSKDRWVASISLNGKSKRLGVFASPEAAHEAYCKAAKEHFGDFSRLG